MTSARLGAAQTGWATTVWTDPGGTTGWGVMSVDPQVLVSNKPLEKSIEHWVCGDTKGNEDQMASEMLELFAMWDDAAIGCERFIIRKFLTHNEFLSPVRIRSKIEYGLWLGEKWEAEDEGRPVGRPRRLYLQDPSLAKSTLTDDLQRSYGLWEAGADHKRDAIKHCFTFLQRARGNPRLRAVAWPLLYKTNGDPLRRLPPTTKRSRY